ncbi:Polyketide cyclase / dehydrase and lipid transport [Actinomadura rubteroloni]|uniref:Polyketide cyclase / dehydrase and lipid transport n=1 Tax=Actinomadura rubteroloni TaxID=1926885 RepID=A0A2P4UHR4_9ACTN|nr:SRPBCC family protein [Actinomadura rubteroloni]POM24604.1 Polyketide cyclase / dehydrase and lipid transport [Actinomadura rubteroloni]
MATVEQSIDVDVPVRTAYDQWTQFEEFPRFMEGVEHVEQTTSTKTHWVTKIAGVTREFDAEITEQLPDERIAWKSTDGPKQAGVVTFHRLAPDKTRVMLQLEHDPEGLAEKAGEALKLIPHRAKGDLERFKSFVEDHGNETGAWRGEVPQNPTH